MSVALVYATWNRGPLLEQSLRRLAELTIPDDILVVDDGSSDSTRQVCEEAAANGLPVRYLYNHRPYEAMCSQAKNVGIKSTDADFLIFSEPEMHFDTDVIAQVVADLESSTEKELVNVGTIHHEQANGAACWCCGQPKHTTVNWQALWIAGFRREWLEDVGGWDEHFPDPWGWDDTDLGTRLRINGVGQYNDLKAEATHLWHPPRVQNQARNNGYFASKNFNGNESQEHPLLVANQGCEWGVLVEA